MHAPRNRSDRAKPQRIRKGRTAGEAIVRRTIGISIFLLLVNFASTEAATPLQPTGLKAFHRSGQTFITWTERSSLTGEWYRVYRHNQPITSENLKNAVCLQQVAEGSGRFFADRYNVESSGTWKARYFNRFVITRLGRQLAAGTGLLVWTSAPQDFGGAARGKAYYAVSTVDRNGSENVEDFSSANACGPVSERVNDPLPVEILRGDSGRGHVYTQFMDLRNWNPTFHAPNESNGHYGLDSTDPAVAHSIQYAYTYTIGEPNPANCPSAMPTRFPVILNLHGWGDNSYGPDTGGSQYYCAFEVRPIDVSETWWFGFARKQDYRRSGTVRKGDSVVNYTESRIMRMIYDLLRDPAFKNGIDPNRLYVYGHSMGASGALALAFRYPGVFAAAYASEPMTNYKTSTMWLENVALKWGSPALNLPVRMQGPGNWAAKLKKYDGKGVWDWQNHQANARSRTGDEFVPFGVAHGRNDAVIDWQTQGRPAYAPFDESKHAWGGAVTDSDHTWLSFAGLPPNYAPDTSEVPFAGLKALRNETVPGLGKASGNLPLPPPNGPGGPGGYNQTIEWSSRWHRWDGVPVDTAKAWGISLRTTDGSTQSVDVTPRRLQTFKIIAGRSYKWENRRVRDNALLAGGSVKADARAILTVPGFQVTPGGNRLRISPQRSWPVTTRGVHVFNDQLAEGMSAKQVRFAATHYAGTQKMIRSEADRLRTVNPDFLVLHYRLGLGLGYRATQGSCEPTGDWLKIVKGNRWVREWPGDAAVAERWFYHWPSSGGPRVLNCDWGWYLMELNDAPFRNYWHDAVLKEVRANDCDGVFMDSLSVPSYLGADHFKPAVPDSDASFERAWANRIKTWLAWLQTQTLSAYYLVPNVGSWITSRDNTDYRRADGLMIEGFAIEADRSPYNYTDWQLQMNRAAKAVARKQAILAQSYATGPRERMFALGSYLLVKGDRTYLNIDLGQDPEWWPEYDIPIGSPRKSIVSGITDLDPDGDKIYRRDFDNGFVLVNPTSPWDGTGVTRKISLGGTCYLAVTSGGGTVPETGVPSGVVRYKAVTGVTLRPYSAAVLFASKPTAATDSAAEKGPSGRLAHASRNPGGA